MKVGKQTFDKLSNSVYDMVKSNTYKGILVPLKGGFLLGNFLSQKLNIPIHYIEISSYENKQQREIKVGIRSNLEEGKYLITDDIYDTGNTIKEIKRRYPHCEFDCCFLVSKQEIEDLYYGELIDSDIWVNFFWKYS